MKYYKKTEFSHELTKEAMDLTFPVETTVSAETIENIIVTSLESASTYWCVLDNSLPEWKNEPEDMPTAQYATQLLLEGKTIVLYDIEDVAERWDLTLQKVLKGIGLAISQGFDITDDVDTVLQLALFGEEVYA